jgi:hypothetical protein
MVAAQVAVRVSVWPETMEEVEALSARELPPSRERMRLRRRSGGLDLNTVRTNEKTDVLGAATDTQRPLDSQLKELAIRLDLPTLMAWEGDASLASAAGSIDFSRCVDG